MNNLTGFYPVAPLLHSVASWLEQRRVVKHAALPDSLPDYLISDVGLPCVHDRTTAARQADMLKAIRIF